MTLFDTVSGTCLADASGDHCMHQIQDHPLQRGKSLRCTALLSFCGSARHVGGCYLGLNKFASGHGSTFKDLALPRTVLGPLGPRLASCMQPMALMARLGVPLLSRTGSLAVCSAD